MPQLGAGLYRKGLARKERLKQLWQSAGNVMKALKRKKKRTHHRRSYNKAMLSMTEGLMYRRPQLRTTDERKQLAHYFAHLEALEFLSPKVRARLAPVSELMMIEKGRYIIKAGHYVTGLYFILSGSVEMTNEYTDVDKDEAILIGATSYFGVIELMENYEKRLGTYRAATDLKLIFVHKDDFENILYEEMRKNWQEKRTVLDSMCFFDYFTERQKMEACQLAKLKEFGAYEEIYDGNNYMSHVYTHFVVSGECALVQRFHTINKRHIKKEEPTTGVPLAHSDIIHLISKLNPKSTTTLRSNLLEDIDSDESKHEGNKTNTAQAMANILRKYNIEPCVADEELLISNELHNASDLSLSIDSLEVELSDEMNESGKMWLSHSSVSTAGSGSIRSSSTLDESLESSIFYIDLCTLTVNGIFGLGERVTDRCFYARSKVQCLMLPRNWLFSGEQNRSHIWSYRKILLNCNMPVDERIYDNHIKDKKWPKLKRELLLQSLGEETLSGGCNNHDIPIMLRMECGLL